MRHDRLEERVRDYVAERADVTVPPRLRSEILRVIASSRPRPVAPRLQLIKVMAVAAALLLLAAGMAWIRIIHETVPEPAGTTHGRWSQAPAMPMGRAFETATTLRNGKVLVVGGVTNIADAIPDAELYDPLTRRWSPTGTLALNLYGQTATLLTDGRVLIAGGADLQNGFGYGPSQSTAELYDPRTNGWSAAGRMITPRAEHTATLLADGRVLVVGGKSEISDPGAPAGRTLASAELFDPKTNTWSAAASLPVGRHLHSAVLLRDHRVLVVGGISGLLNSSNGLAPRTAELYDPAANKWSAGASMQFTRVSPTASLLPDGRVLVVGDIGVNELTAEIYDPSRDSWSPAPSSEGLRAGHVAVPLSDGDVLVAGGAGEASAQLYDWRRNIWLNAGPMDGAREGAAAAVLASGQVLVAGGFGSPVAALPTAELYDPNGISRPVRVLPGSHVLMPAAIPALAFGLVLAGLVLWTLRRRAPRSKLADDWINSG